MFRDEEAAVWGKAGEHSLLEFRSQKMKNAGWIDLFKGEFLVSSSSGKILHGGSMREQNADSESRSATFVCRRPIEPMSFRTSRVDNHADQCLCLKACRFLLESRNCGVSDCAAPESME